MEENKIVIIYQLDLQYWQETIKIDISKKSIEDIFELLLWGKICIYDRKNQENIILIEDSILRFGLNMAGKLRTLVKDENSIAAQYLRSVPY
jgi:hypothetical protein